MTPTLVRAIGRWGLAGLMLNGVIGSSVFGLPSVIAGMLGPVSPWAWIVAALGVGVVVACFAEVASRFGEAGGPYLYGRAAFGRLAGIEMGWVAYLVRLTAGATNANLFVIYLGQFWPATQAPLASRLVLAALIAPLALVNYRGVASGTRLSGLLLSLKLVPLCFFVLAGLALLLPTALVATTAAVPQGNWLDAILLLVFAYGGFEAALIPLGEASSPERDAPFALFITLGVCAVLYSLVQLVVLAALADPASAARPLAAAAREFLGPAGAGFMTVAALLSVYGYLAGAMVNVPRLTYAMAAEGDLPRGFARVHPRFRTPATSVVVYAILVWLLAASGGFLSNLSLSAVSRLFTYGVVCAALPRLRTLDRIRPATAPARFQLPAGGLWAMAGIGFALVLATRMTRQELVLMMLTLVLGMVNWLWVRSARSARRVEQGEA
jgi:basic amino acid/polyamine antiporter, APA family